MCLSLPYEILDIVLNAKCLNFHVYNNVYTRNLASNGKWAVLKEIKIARSTTPFFLGNFFLNEVFEAGFVTVCQIPLLLPMAAAYDDASKNHFDF